MKTKIINAYLARAEQVIGKRTPEETAHDDAVVKALNEGYPIEVALAAAAAKHPTEAIQWTPETLADIATHYDYLKEHAAILNTMKQRGRKS